MICLVYLQNDTSMDSLYAYFFGETEEPLSVDFYIRNYDGCFVKLGPSIVQAMARFKTRLKNSVGKMPSAFHPDTHVAVGIIEDVSDTEYGQIRMDETRSPTRIEIFQRQIVEPCVCYVKHENVFPIGVLKNNHSRNLNYSLSHILKMLPEVDAKDKDGFYCPTGLKYICHEKSQG